ncbi:hypothetical protein [Microbispora rosea]|uniref:hypothetical protein n=1 Tax=Microbispora rosea TaxID=58117 RepID=UPI0037BA2297
MPPDSKREGDAPAPERRPHTKTADHTTAQTATIVGPDAVTGTASNARRRYAAAYHLSRFAIAARARAAAELGHDESAAAESLELVRLTLHREVDQLVDAEALRRPSARRLIARATRYDGRLA